MARRTPKRSTAPPVRSKRSFAIPAAAALVLAAALAAYSNSFAGILVFDDEPAIAQNTHLRSLWPLAAAMAAPADTTLSGRPVAALSFAIDYAISEDALRGYHRTNLLVHLAAALLLFGITRRTLLTPALAPRYGTAATRLAAIVALLFAVHPLGTSAVTYVVQRVESLMGMLYLATLYCAIRALDAEGRTRLLWSGASVLACALGMATKEVMATAPLAVALWDWTFAPGRASSRRALYGALASTWIVLAVLVAGGHRSLSVGFGFAEWPWWRYLMTQAGVLVRYLRLAFAPDDLVLDYDWRPASLPQAVPPIAAIGVLLALTIVGVARRRPAAFAGAWCFLVLAPTSSVIPIATEVAAEHRMYLPVAGIAALVVIGLFEAGRRLAGPSAKTQSSFATAGLVAAGAVAVLFGYLTHARNADYHDYDRIWLDTIAKRPQNVRARNNYATSLLLQGRYAEAERHLRAAVERPGFADAEMNLGVALSAQGALDEGAAHLRRAIAIQPRLVDARRNLAETYVRQRRPGEAVAEYATILESQPDNVEILNRAAWILATTDDPRVRDGARARRLAERAVGLTMRRHADSLDNLGAALAEIGSFDQAMAVTAEAIAVARSTGQPSLVPDLEQRLLAYRAHQPIRLP